MSTAEELVARRAVMINHQPGTVFVRAAMAMALSRSGWMGAARIAKERWPGDGLAEYIERAAIGATGTEVGGGAALVAPGAVEVLNIVRPRTVTGRLPRLRRVPFYRDGAALSIGTAEFAWLGEGIPTPVGRFTFTPVSLPTRKAGGIVVATDALLKMSSVDAEILFRDEIVNGLVEFTDTKFLSADAEVAGVSPAGVANGAVSTATAGDAETDLTVLLSGFTNLEGVSVVASEKTGIALAAKGIFRDGRLYETLPVVLSNAAGNRLIAIDAPNVMYAEEPRIDIDTSNQASIIMDTAPSGVVQVDLDPPTHTSLWQSNLSAVKVLRWMNWQPRTGAVRVITGVTY